MHKSLDFVYSMIHKRLDYNLKTTKLTSSFERCRYCNTLNDVQQ